MSKSTDALLDSLKSDLEECLGISAETPLVNAYQQMSYRLLGKMKAGQVTSDDISGIVDELGTQGLVSRGRRAASYLQETDPQTNKHILTRLFTSLGRNKTFAEYRDFVERELAGIVVTGHPTFGLSHEQYDIVSALVDNSISADRARELARDVNWRVDKGLTLEYEFSRSEHALVNLQSAIRVLYEAALEAASLLYPEEWTTLNPKLLTAASWVGFDVDGRDDISWLTSIGFRFRMAIRQCDEFRKWWSEANPGQTGRVPELLADLSGLFDRDLTCFSRIDNSPESVRNFSRYIVKDRPSAQKLISDINLELDKQIAASTEKDITCRLITFKGMFNNFRTGLSHIHFRLNSVQLHNAIRPLVALGKDPDDPAGRRRYLTAASKLLDHIEPVTAGFENIIHEQTTAKRLFIIIAQIFKYIDPVTPIRFLIAECDTPFTVLAALCYARLFGVEDKIDISPLFETDQALLRGAELIEELLENPHYLAYVRKRKRLCVQAGYSDAGRYLGQIAAGMAIERLRIKLAELWTRFNLEGVELVIFDTGGESLGRGAHPKGFAGRLDYIHTPEARRQIARNRINYKQEVSLQGGDGYLWLSTPEIALATVTRLFENLLQPLDLEPDPFYKNTDWSLDFFLTVKDFNKQISDNPDFMKLVSLLGVDISYPSGSRMTVRRDEGVARRPLEKLNQIRAIPNNMLLHQLGCLANSLGGIGTALQQDGYGFWRIYEQSPRLRHLALLVRSALDLSDEDFLGAYTSLFRPRYWMHAARYETESQDHDRMLRLAKMLGKSGVYEGLNRVELTLREDLMYLRDALEGRELTALPFRQTGEERTAYMLLHIVRMALIQKIFLLATRIPRFRNHKGLSVDDMILGILQLQVGPMLEHLREIFPLEGEYDIDEDNPEGITYKGDNAHGYEYENRVIFDEMEEAYDQVRRVSQALSAFIGAVG